MAKFRIENLIFDSATTSGVHICIAQSAILFIAFSLLTLFAPAFGQTGTLKQQLAAMETTLFSKTFCKDKPIRRIERLEENFLDAQKQKEKDLPTRVNELIEKIKPADELLTRPDPCEENESGKSKGLMEKIMGQHAEQDTDISDNQFPVIKWKPVNIIEINDAVAKLSTDFEATGRGYGKLKYKILLKLPNGTRFPRFLTITLMDQNGFKLKDFVVSGNFFKETGTPDYWEANESQGFSEKDYKQARRYSISVQ